LKISNNLSDPASWPVRLKFSTVEKGKLLPNCTPGMVSERDWIWIDCRGEAGTCGSKTRTARTANTVSFGRIISCSKPFRDLKIVGAGSQCIGLANGTV
jgi:hypothetical protein